MKYKAVLFDMDGTVMDSLEDMNDAVNITLEHFSFPPISLEQTRCYVGNGARRLIEQAVPEGTDPELTEQAIQWYVPYYSGHCMIKTRPYRGIPELMERLRNDGVRIAVVSNKPASATEEITGRFFRGIADFSIGESSELRRKPWPDMVDRVVKEFCLSKGDCVYVGDSEVDILTAKNSDMRCISVLWGFRSREQLEEAGAECFAHDPEELYRLLTEET